LLVVFAKLKWAYFLMEVQMPEVAEDRRGDSSRRFSIVPTSRMHADETSPMGRIVGTAVLVAALVLGTWFFIDAATLAITTLERHHPNYLAEQ
jgi:hypothetical protein